MSDTLRLRDELHAAILFLIRLNWYRATPTLYTYLDGGAILALVSEESRALAREREITRQFIEFHCADISLGVNEPARVRLADKMVRLIVIDDPYLIVTPDGTIDLRHLRP